MRTIPLIFSALLLMGALTIHAADTPMAFQQGLDAFNDADYAVALDHFQQARAEGMNSGKLHYNIGVSHFKLSQYTAAIAAFRQASTDPALASLAYYNLALVAYQQDKPSQVRHWLKLCRNSRPDARLLALAKTLQSRLTPSSRTSSLLHETRFIAINIGLDDNVTLRDDNQTSDASGQADEQIDLFAFYQQRRRVHDKLTLSFDSSLYQLDYLRLDAYDVGLFRLGGVIARDIDQQWQLRGDGHISHTVIAGSRSSRTLSIQGGIHHKKAGHRAGLDLQIARIDALNPSYNHLSGWRYRLIAKTSWRQASQRYNIKASLSRNDRADFRNASRFSSYSPQRLSLSGKLRMPLNKKLKGSVKLDWRHSRYRDPNRLTDSSLIRRSEQRWRLTTALKHPLNKDTNLQLDYRYSRNSSTLDRYDYQRSQIRLGIQHSW